MKLSTKYYLLLAITLAAYILISKIIFDKVNKTINVVVDELFHLPQGLAYCNGFFNYWDPKITTLPGLYLISVVLGQYLPCNIYNLRLVNLIGSCLNLLLFSSIFKFTYGNLIEPQHKIVLQALNLAILPPLYFFSHVYYTETLSLTFLLLYFRTAIVNKSKWMILIFAFCSVMMRQSNIVWVAMMLGHKLLEIVIRSSRVYGNSYLSNSKIVKQSSIAKNLDPSKLKQYYGIREFVDAFKYHFSTAFLTAFKYITYEDWFIISQHCLSLSSFLVFIYVNGSIVVGDKEAHKPSLNLPQVFYFLLFYGVFGLSYVLAKFVSTLKLILENKFTVFACGIMMALTIYFNTTAHPYLLADNRHYMFYIWNRWFAKYYFAKYVTIPIYLFLLMSLCDNLMYNNCISFFMPFFICMVPVLALQKLVEIRYFLLPYIILRLRFVKPSFKMVLFEFVWYLFLNILTFYVFFTKEITWTDYSEPQRIIW